MASKAIVIKGLDASGSPLGKINFVVEPQDLTSQIKWMGKYAGQANCRIFEIGGGTTLNTLVTYESNAAIQFIGYGRSVGFLDVTEFQGATLELKSHPYNVGDNRYFNICFASALSDDGTTPIVDEGIGIIPINTSLSVSNAVRTISVYKDSSSSMTEMRTAQLTVPTVSSGHVYFVFTDITDDETFGGWVKIV